MRGNAGFGFVRHGMNARAMDFDDDSAHGADKLGLIVEAQVVNDDALDGPLLDIPDQGDDAFGTKLDPDVRVNHVAPPVGAKGLVEVAQGLVAKLWELLVLVRLRGEAANHLLDGVSKTHAVVAPAAENLCCGGLARLCEAGKGHKDFSIRYRLHCA